MDGAFIQRLVEEVRRPMEAGGYVWHPEGWKVSGNFVAEALKIYSLGALRDYLIANRDTIDVSKCVVHVVSPQIVRVCGPLTEKFRAREVYIEAQATNLTDGFIGKLTSHEEFIIGLQTRFAESDDRKAVLRLIGNIKHEAVKTSADDGVTQTVQARAGVVLQQDVAVPNPIELVPYRTFREVTQPSSLFVLRVQANGTATPHVGLFEADGGAWRLTAIDRVRDWLKNAMPEGVAVLA